MEINQILNSDLLDIIFEDRNKEYGAYELRKHYNDRLMKAGILSLVIIFLLITGYILANKFSGRENRVDFGNEVTLVEAPVAETKREVVVPPKLRPELPKVEAVKDVVPIIVPDHMAPDDQRPPTVDELENARIGTVSTHGIKDDGMEPPAVVEDKRGIIAIPKSDLDEGGKIFYKVEIESTYPGGASAWMRYLNKTFKYPDDAQKSGLQGTVTVQFIVDKEGNVSDVVAVSGPENGGLREEAVRVIMKSGKWEPAIQNGNHVNSYKKQPITFKLEAE